MIRLVIVDDEALIRAGLRVVLQAETDLEVVGEAVDGQDAIEVCGRLGPDVVLMDVRMPRLDGIAATRALTRSPDGPAVLVLTTFAHDDYLWQALRAGAAGFALKRADPAELAHAVRVVAGGESLVLPLSRAGCCATPG